jgi:hypothetical protein
MSTDAFYYKATQLDRVSTAVASDDPDLIAPLSAGLRYRINTILSFFSASATPGIRYAVAYSGTITQVICSILETTQQAANNATTHQINFLGSTDITGATNFTRNSSATANTRHKVHVQTFMTVGTSGNFSIKWAQSVSNATATSLAAGAHMVVELF